MSRKTRDFSVYPANLGYDVPSNGINERRLVTLFSRGVHEHTVSVPPIDDNPVSNCKCQVRGPVCWRIKLATI